MLIKGNTLIYCIKLQVEAVLKDQICLFLHLTEVVCSSASFTMSLCNLHCLKNVYAYEMLKMYHTKDK